MSETKLPGVKSRHAIITQECRERGQGIVVAETLERVKITLDDILTDHRCDMATIHVAVTIEYPEN